MPLINCPECSKEVSDQAGACPNCGISIKQKKRKAGMSKKTKIIAVALAAVIILGGAGAFVGLQIHNNNLEREQIAEEQRLEEYRLAIIEEKVAPVILLIKEIGDVSLESEMLIEQAKEACDELTIEEKVFVYNYELLEQAIHDFYSLPITLTVDNIRNYLQFNTHFSNYKSSSSVLLGYRYWLASVDLVADIVSLQNVTYENVQIKITCKVDTDVLTSIGWDDIAIDITIPHDGKLTIVTPVSYDSLLYSPSAPSKIKDFKIVSVSGKVFKEK
jgi:hypothetical protein